MLVLRLDSTNDLLDAIFILIPIDETANLKCSPAMLSLTVSHYSSDFVVALEMMPQFFNHFFSDHISNSLILLQPLFHTIVGMKVRGFSSVVLSLELSLDDQRNHLSLQFRSPGDWQVLFRQLALWPLSIEEEDADQINLGTFVSIDDQQFGHIITTFDGQLVHVTLTESQVKFSKGIEEIIFTKEGRQCIIGGVATGDEIQFIITLHPINFFRNMTFRSERVWLHKTTTSRSVIVVPVGLHAQFAVYYSQ